MPASLQFLGVLNEQFPMFEVGIGNPKELHFVDLGILLSALTCSLVLLGSWRVVSGLFLHKSVFFDLRVHSVTHSFEP